MYGDGPWRYIKTTAKDREGAYLRPSAEMEHLMGLEAVRGDFPVFRFEFAADQAGRFTGRREFEATIKLTNN